MTDGDTIAAVATPLGNGGIGIIRISGDMAAPIVQKITGMRNIQSHRIRYGHVYDETGQVVDEVLVSFMAAPRSYTCEDVAEVNCHGGIVSMRRVFACIVQAGARPASPGEFTKRAFLNGRIDLSQAEAVMDLITAKTQLSHKTAMAQAEGRLSRKLMQYKGEILSMLAHIEASIDYPEADMEPVNRLLIRERVGGLINSLNRLLATADTGRLLRDGIGTVIVGRPNVGKSSLLNAILDEERAIVTDIPGTTRDLLSEYADIGGIPLKITDTAGIRSSGDKIEQIGVERAMACAQGAELILFVADRSAGIHEEDLSILERLPDQKMILLLNKSDLAPAQQPGRVPASLPQDRVIEVSIKHRTGLDKLYEAIAGLFYSGQVTHEQDDVITSIRHAHALHNAVRSLTAVADAVGEGIPEDLLAIDLTDSYRHLCEITGEALGEDIIDRIFSEFCLGK